MERCQKLVGLALEAKLPDAERERGHEHGRRFRAVAWAQSHARTETRVDKFTEVVSLIR